MTTGVWLAVGIGVGIVVVVGALVALSPLLRARPPAAAEGSSGGAMPTSAGAMLKGFGYLYAPRRGARHTDSVNHRFTRAMLRIDAVDPYLAPRRIGLALAEAGFTVAEPPTEESLTAESRTAESLTAEPLTAESLSAESLTAEPPTDGDAARVDGEPEHPRNADE